MSIRPESSVSLEIDEYGELVFAGDRNGAVIQRTPEELGIPRVVAEPSHRPTWWRTSSVETAWPEPHRRRALTAAEQDRIRRQMKKPRRHTIKGVEVCMPANAVMGAEMIDLLAAELEAQAANNVQCDREDEEMRGSRITEEVRQQICQEPETMTAPEMARKHGIYPETVKAIRGKAGLTCAKGSPGGAGIRRRAVNAASGDGKAQRGTSLVRPVEIDAGRPGAAAALLGALAKVDAQPVEVALRFTQEELGGILGRLNEDQRSAFVSGGLRAVLLAR